MVFPIPDSALAQHIAILGKTGSGKTTAAKGAVELILDTVDSGARPCIIDPTGAWWGMKSSATGKSAGYPFVIFGGEHADFPLAAAHGEAIAEIVGTTNTPAIIDTSQMRIGERTKFFTEFADGIMRKNRGPLHLVIDEAHMFMPQGKVPDPSSGMMLAAGNHLVSGGRSRGLRIMLITQRPAKLHKDALTQVETLVAMRLIAPQDRKAVEEWIKDNADAGRGREIIETLATLKTGQAWVWAPEIRMLERVQFPRIKTFDSSAAPSGHADGKGPVLASINRESISDRLKVHAEQVAANDPAELKRQVRELQKQLAAKVPDIDEAGARKREDDAFQRGYADGKRSALDYAATVVQTIGVDVANLFRGTLSNIATESKKTDDARPENPVRSVARPAGTLLEPSPNRASGARARQIDGRASSLTACARKCLAVLAQFGDCNAVKLALLTGYRYSGGFRNALSELRTAGLIIGENTNMMSITPQGIQCGPFEELPEGEALGEYWLNHPSLGKCSRDVLAQLLKHPRGMNGQQLASATGYEYSGGFRNALSDLRTAGVLVGKNTEVMRAHEDLF